MPTDSAGPQSNSATQTELPDSSRGSTTASPRRTPWGLIVGVGILLAAGIAGWALYPIDHVANAKSVRDFTIEVEFDKFRQIMVRKKATATIVAHSGMELLDERIEGVSIEARRQDRPLLRALLGQADAELSAVKELTVSTNDSRLGIDQLALVQHADIQPQAMYVRTVAPAGQGNLESYATELTASSADSSTSVKLMIDQAVRVRVPRMFVSTAERKVQQAADNATWEQEQAIRTFISTHEDQRIILPELN